MQMGSSAKRAGREVGAGSLETATVRTPSSRHAFRTRSAISPRLATSTLRNIHIPLAAGLVTPHKRITLPDGKEWLPKLDGLPIGYEALDELARNVSFDLVHQFHGLDNADDLPFLNVVTGRNEGCRAGGRRTVKCTDNRRLDQMQFFFNR